MDRHLTFNQALVGFDSHRPQKLGFVVQLAEQHPFKLQDLSSNLSEPTRLAGIVLIGRTFVL